MSTVDERLSYVERQIVSMDKDIDSSNKMASKFDQSLDKMSEAVSSIQQLLAVHDSQLRRQHEANVEIHRTNDDSKKAMILEIEKSHKNIEGKIDKLDEDISDKLGEIATGMSDHDRRIRGLERITFIGLGLAMLIGLLVDKIPFDKIF